MSELRNYNNLYLDLSQSAYEEMPNSFRKRLIRNKEVADLNYSIGTREGNTEIIGGKNLPNNGILYVHKDKNTRNVLQITPNGPIFVKMPLLSDIEEGFNSYFLTDTPELNKDTKNAYLAVKGSDFPSLDNLYIPLLNDWLGNNYPFVMHDEYIPQGKLVEEALHVKLAELREKAPNAKLNMTGHSLGSIASVQGAAHLSVEELEQIGEIVVLNGPDTLKSLRKSGISEEVIQILNEKVTYYVNPFDIVSMLNRNTDEQLGKVKVIVPFNFSTTFGTPSSHDFGEYRIHSDGKILEATEDFFPAYLKAGEKLSKLLNKYIELIKEGNSKFGLDKIGGPPEILLTLVNGGRNYSKFMEEYQAIIDETKEAVIAWGNKNIPILQAAIQGATGAKKIELRSRLLLCISHLSRIESDEKVKLMKNELENYRQQVKEVVEKANHEAYHAGAYLGRNEVSQLVSHFQFSTVWDEAMFSHNVDELNRYMDKIVRFSDKLFTAVETLEDIDRKQSELFKVVSNSSFSLNSYKIERG
ncbi:hypothetical protein [Granulicatella adiacens]|uniref:hypothetical protein n=1 Tax=Granulicatella adiacens TaxID=46124 RepID=UPI00241EC133|nr:hypothetical protein [Granulicatella adiacens]